MAKLINYSQLSTCPGDIKPFKDYLHEHLCMSEKPHIQIIAKCLPELLVNVCSYCVNGKSVLAVVFVEAGFSQIQSHLWARKIV